MRFAVHRNLKKLYLKEQRSIELKNHIYFKSETLIPGFFGWKMYVFDSLSEFLSWYLKSDKLIKRVATIDNKIAIVRYTPVYYSKNETPAFELSTKCIQKVTCFLNTKSISQERIEKTLGYLNKPHIFKKLLTPQKAKFYAVAFISSTIENEIS